MDKTFNYMIDRITNRKISIRKIGELADVSPKTIENIVYKATDDPGYFTVTKLVKFFKSNPHV